MLVLDGDPLADIANLKRIHRVVKDGAVFSPSQILPSNPEWVVQQQLDAYNARNIDQFLSHFHGEAELLKHPGGEVIAKGKAELRRIYSKLFESSPKLRCRLLSRIVQGNIVTDHELVTGHSRKPYLHGVAIYEVEGELIKRVWFLSP